MTPLEVLGWTCFAAGNVVIVWNIVGLWRDYSSAPRSLRQANRDARRMGA